MAADVVMACNCRRWPFFPGWLASCGTAGDVQGVNSLLLTVVLPSQLLGVQDRVLCFREIKQFQMLTNVMLQNYLPSSFAAAPHADELID